MTGIQAHGVLVLSRTMPLATTAADGTFVLTIHAFDRQGPQKVESWRVVYTGAGAKDFWQQAKMFLVPGTPISISAQRVRATNTGRFGGAEIEAHATHIVLTPRQASHFTHSTAEASAT
jgi:hypothetical protein